MKLEELLKPLEVEKDADMNRLYIAVGTDFEVQTKGNGSTFRILNKKTGERRPYVLAEHQIRMLEQMAHHSYNTHEPLRKLAALVPELVEALDRIHQLSYYSGDCTELDVVQMIRRKANESYIKGNDTLKEIEES